MSMSADENLRPTGAIQLMRSKSSAQSPKRPVRTVRGHSLALALALATALLSAVTLQGTPASSAAVPKTRPIPFAHASIIGGGPAADGTFPSLAYVLDVQGKDVFQCTGTVVAPSLVLTAGHCAENMKTGVVNKPSGYRVVTGTVDPMLPEPHVSTVLGVIVYPGLIRRFDDGDAALLVLAAPTAAPAITLAASGEMNRLRAGLSAVMVGWGLTSFTQTLPTDRLQSASTVVQGRKWCSLNAPPFFPKSELCAITPPSYDTGACAGDSGGPLLAQPSSGGAAVQIGIAVHVYGRCSTRHPSVFVSVGSIASWVRTWIAAYKVPPPPPPPSPAPALPAPSSTSPVPLSSGT
jgi:secreted trypsin-like serine protease